VILASIAVFLAAIALGATATIVVRARRAAP
jgi:hypothetical protein